MKKRDRDFTSLSFTSSKGGGGGGGGGESHRSSGGAGGSGGGGGGGGSPFSLSRFLPLRSRRRHHSKSRMSLDSDSAKSESSLASHNVTSTSLPAFHHNPAAAAAAAAASNSIGNTATTTTTNTVYTTTNAATTTTTTTLAPRSHHTTVATAMASSAAATSTTISAVAGGITTPTMTTTTTTSTSTTVISPISAGGGGVTTTTTTSSAGCYLSLGTPLPLSSLSQSPALGRVSPPPPGEGEAVRECPVCLTEQTLDCFPPVQTCEHRSCLQCLRRYLAIEISESRVNIACPECNQQFHPNDIGAILEDGRLTGKYQDFMLRRVLAMDPDTRWCPAPDCGYAVIAAGCAGCPKLKCEREGCDTFFCYHCKQHWHPNQTCDAARAERSPNIRSASVSYSHESSAQNEIKPCPRCSAFIFKMNDGSCNHMTCAVCAAEFCWLCMKEISDLHYLSPSGCTFWGRKPWSRKKKILWQLGTLVGAPVGITLVAGVAVPAMIIAIPVWVGRKIHARYRLSSKHRRNLAITGGVLASILASPIVAGLAVGIGVPILLAYVYGVVPISLCRSGGCGVTTTNTGGVRFEFDEEAEANAQANFSGDNQSESMPAVANPSIAPSIGDASLGMTNSLSASGSHMDRVGVLRDADSDRDSSSNRAIAGASLNGSLCGSTYTNKLEVQVDMAPASGPQKRASFSSESANISLSEKSATVSFDEASLRVVYSDGYRENGGEDADSTGLDSAGADLALSPTSPTSTTSTTTPGSPRSAATRVPTLTTTEEGRTGVRGSKKKLTRFVDDVQTLTSGSSSVVCGDVLSWPPPPPAPLSSSSSSHHHAKSSDPFSKAVEFSPKTSKPDSASKPSKSKSSDFPSSHHHHSKSLGFFSSSKSTDFSSSSSCSSSSFKPSWFSSSKKKNSELSSSKSSGDFCPLPRSSHLDPSSPPSSSSSTTTSHHQAASPRVTVLVPSPRPGASSSADRSDRSLPPQARSGRFKRSSTSKITNSTTTTSSNNSNNDRHHTLSLRTASAPPAFQETDFPVSPLPESKSGSSAVVGEGAGVMGEGTVPGAKLCAGATGGGGGGKWDLTLPEVDTDKPVSSSASRLRSSADKKPVLSSASARRPSSSDSVVGRGRSLSASCTSLDKQLWQPSPPTALAGPPQDAAPAAAATADGEDATTASSSRSPSSSPSCSLRRYSYELAHRHGRILPPPSLSKESH